MAINTISYATKSDINTSSVSATNKVSASDMNDIKDTVNTNANLMGDLTLLETLSNTSIVDSINSLKGSINTLITADMVHVTGTLANNAWRILYSDNTITVDEDGTYLLVCLYKIGTKTNGMVTARPYIDNADVGLAQTTYSNGNAYLINICITGLVELTAGTHVLNAQAISQSSMVINTNGSMALIKVGA